MMRGPSYDDSYITRKMSSMPTFMTPAPQYGRQPPMAPGYMQDPYGYDYMPRQNQSSLVKSSRRKFSKSEVRVQKSEDLAVVATARDKRSSSLMPYLWPEVDNNKMERTQTKGWYRADFGPSRVTETWYLPTVKDRMRFLLDRQAASPHEPHQAASMTPVREKFSEKMRLKTDAVLNRSSPERASKDTAVVKHKTNTEDVPVVRRRDRKRYSMIEMEEMSDMKPALYYVPSNTNLRPVIYTADRSVARSRPTSVSGEEGMALVPYTRTPQVTPRPALATTHRARPHSLPPPVAWSGYPPMGPPPPRMVPRAMHYDYEYPPYGGGYGGYGYGGGYGGGYAPPPPPPQQPAPRMSRYDNYMDEDTFLEPSSYVPRLRSRQQAPEMDDYGYGKQAGGMGGFEGPDDSMALVPARPRVRRAHLESGPRPETSVATVQGETEGDRHLARLERRYPSLSEPQMLQEHVDNMRIKLKSLAFSLDPSGPVPDIIIPESKRRTAAADTAESKYSKALDFADLPKIASRRQRYYPEDEHMKDNLRIKCLSHYKTTRTAADASHRTPSMLDSSYSNRYSAAKSDPKWEEPDQVFGAGSDRKPFSKTEGAVEEVTEEKKERRKKKKSRERDLDAICAAPAADVCGSEPSEVCDVPATPAPDAAPAPVSADPPSVSIEETVEDEKERKKLEKKKRKAEREAAAKAAMEAELAALEQAEAELARLEAESSSIKTDSSCIVPEVHPVPAAAPAPVEAPAAEAPAAEVKSESAAEK